MPPPVDPGPPDPLAWLAGLRDAMRPWSGAGVVVAVSGGGDSVGLLRGLVAVGPELGLRLAVACFDHATRAGESARDAAFVVDLAGRLGLPVDVGRWQHDRPTHFEADARRARYAWLLGVAQARGAAAVAVGHTSDDQAETILHRVVRGTGLRGLGGMPPRRRLGSGVTLVRPILGATRAEIRRYLASIDQSWREDASNADQARTRARVRHDLLPRLAADYNPDVAAALVRLGHLAASATARADRRAARRLARLVVARDAATVGLDRAGLRRLVPADRVDVLRLAWRRQGWPEGEMTHRRWLRLDALAAEGGTARVAIGAGVEAATTPDRLTLRRAGPILLDVPPDPRSLAIPGSAPWPGGRVVATLDPIGVPSSTAEWVDRAAIRGPLVVRAAVPGDRFAPLGLDGRSQPLADFFRGRDVPRLARPLVPLVADAEGIIWVAGHRIAHRVRRTEGTTRVVGLRYEQ